MPLLYHGQILLRRIEASKVGLAARLVRDAHRIGLNHVRTHLVQMTENPQHAVFVQQRHLGGGLGAHERGQLGDETRKVHNAVELGRRRARMRAHKLKVLQSQVEFVHTIKFVRKTSDYLFGKRESSVNLSIKEKMHKVCQLVFVSTCARSVRKSS